MIGRRRQLAGMLGALAAPSIAAAQDRRRPLLALLAPTSLETEIAETGNPFWRLLFGELRRRGYEEGRTLDVSRWSARGDTARYPALAREIADSKPDVILAVSTPIAQVLQAATTTIPIVANAGNLVEFGLADSYARPGRNVTGIAAASGMQFSTKRLELLREATAASRIAILMPRTHWDRPDTRLLWEAESRLGVTLVGALLDDPILPPAYRRAFAAMSEQRVDALMLLDTPEHFVHRQLIAELAIANRLPTAANVREFTEAGGLMSYALDLAEVVRPLVACIANILQGAKPAEMPIRIIDKYELVLNLKTARALNLTIPPAILARADEVIE